MPRYFIDTDDGEMEARDDEGTLFPDGSGPHRRAQGAPRYGP